MPKGVEHSCVENDDKNSLHVKIPMMPKGVEHSFRAAIERLKGW